MGREILAFVYQIAREKGIDSQIVVQAVESALLVAAKKKYGGDENIRVRLDLSNGDLEVITLKKVVETLSEPRDEITLEEARVLDEAAALGDEIGMFRETLDFGRIAAQTAKQVILQKVREAEWEGMRQEYAGRQGELLSGVVIGQERRNYIVQLGKGEAILPHQELPARESYRRGDRLRAYLLEVRTTSDGPQIVLSRAHPQFVVRLFEAEVPEIASGTVSVVGVVREAGDRTKISVASKEPRIDPVGACVGVRGCRIQAVVRELRGEKIDIISWTDDPRTFIGEALSPAVIEKVGINESEKSALIVVSDTQFSLAIGKRGQNVRLATQLTGWKLDLISRSEYEQQRAKERGELPLSSDVSETVAVSLPTGSEEPAAGESSEVVEAAYSLSADSAGPAAPSLS